MSTTLKIGDRVPDELISNITNLSIDRVAHRVAHISDFRGKLLILDFWATWCAPCRAMVPVMDSLQRVFGDRVVFLPVTYENKPVVEPVLAQMQKQHPFNLPEVTGDTKLHALFPHRALPHYVWIDGSGVLRAVTEFKEVTGANIRAMLDKSASASAMAQKRDARVSYDKTKPIFIGGNGGDGSAMIYHSLLTGYQEGIGGGMNIGDADSIKGQRFTVRNSGLIWLERMAYADSGWFSDNRVRLETKDSLTITGKVGGGQAYVNWLKAGNGWCYELQVPPALVKEAHNIMHEEFQRFFPKYRVKVETRSARSLVLVRTSHADKLKSTGGNYTINVGPYGCHLHNVSLTVLMVRLDTQFMQNSPLPIANATGYTGMVDLDIESPWTDLEAVNQALTKYDLAFVEKVYPAKLLVIRDAPLTTLNQAQRP